MKNVEKMISARWIIPVEPDNQVLDHHTLVIHEGRILDLLPTSEAEQRYQADTHRHLGRHALIPGLINAHTHSPMTLLRGLADDLPLMDWLQNHIWPAEGRFVGEDFVRDGSLLAAAEMLRGGTTCFNDMYFFPETTAQVASQAGLRAAIGLIVIDFPSSWAANGDEYIAKGLEIYDRHKGNALLSFCFAPHAPYTVSDEPLKRLVTLANELDLPIHMHVHETAHEVNEATARFGVRPLERLARLGLSGANLMAVHMTQLEPAEIAHLAQAGTHVVHCPESNLKLASGFCPVQALLEAGVNVALGTDGTASNNDLDMFGEMRTAALLAKGVSGNAAALPAHTALRMATLHGARALGLADEIGSLVPGKNADITAVFMEDLECRPVYDPVSHLIYACGRHQVSDVWVSGRPLLRDRQLTTIDETDLHRRIGDWQEKIARADHQATSG
ncbi:TRZ/ATZ family hydrolase [Ectothiorhodospira lacustris]|uniref:TRZ/ATZ family hydrolase n=1 Tax=Ectothiorhodospira lacustris TaxID=2899127 RepID=UPI001EE94411|nr:TRZ/ATZ family hydrolase [Ectothiorhodospira lacustris]MCG5501278.1 TRZ/ATZ family hydrolase [Ectothiorhodospira lacustris]MCG5509302.1 TRZ/ATZ family hydrolase [Ectothiorhodospira lacustris]MCG5521356.1 TRZ/ATZ family hydrolase [Ectothiorhodospira lacustris]